MTKNLDNEGLKSIIKNYDLFFIDLWGVVHNGIKLNEKAIDVLAKISEAKNLKVKKFFNWKLFVRSKIFEVKNFGSQKIDWRSQNDTFWKNCKISRKFEKICFEKIKIKSNSIIRIFFIIYFSLLMDLIFR